MFTRKISKQTKLYFILIILPLYVYCGSLIASALTLFSIRTFSLHLDSYFITVILNLLIDGAYCLIGFALLKDSLIEQFKDFIKNFKENMVWGCIIGVVLLYVGSLVGSILSAIFSDAITSQNQSLIETIAAQYPYYIFLMSVILAPICEEMLFRGMIFSWLYELSPNIARYGSAFLFGFVHVMTAIFAGDFYEFFQIFPYFFMGLALGYVYEKRNNIYVSMLAHAGMNLIGVLMMIYG